MDKNIEEYIEYFQPRYHVIVNNNGIPFQNFYVDPPNL